MSDISPQIDEDGVGWCSTYCPQVFVAKENGVQYWFCEIKVLGDYNTKCADGKTICIPHIIRLAAENKRLKAENAHLVKLMSTGDAITGMISYEKAAGLREENKRLTEELAGAADQ